MDVGSPEEKKNFWGDLVFFRLLVKSINESVKYDIIEEDKMK